MEPRRFFMNETAENQSEIDELMTNPAAEHEPQSYSKNKLSHFQPPIQD